MTVGVRILLIVLGVIALVVGAVFIGQGSGLLLGSVMTGERTWLYVGLALVVIGIVLIVLAARRRRAVQR